MDALLGDAVGWLDPLLIGFFRLSDSAMTGFLTGTFCVCLLCVVLGELTLSAAIRFNRGHLHALQHEVSTKESLSMQAYGQGDRASYRALNQAANDAWGKYFFTMAAYSAGMLWPIPFALAWMQTRFAEVAFDLAFPLNLVFGDQVGYPFVFIPMYVLARILFKNLRSWLPYFRGVQAMLDQGRARG